MTVTTICFSLVLFKHPVESISPLLASTDSLSEHKDKFRVVLCVYDGSPREYLSPTIIELRRRIPSFDVFLERGQNIGFGRANNRNFKRSLCVGSSYFVVVNPDIRFNAEQLMPLIGWMLSCSECACVAPLVLLESGGIQYSAKHNPTVLSLLLGRFCFLRRARILRRYDAWHRNLHRDYASETIISTYLSGCFLLMPTWAFASVGGFCEKYFLHVEDADIVRRLSRIGKTLHNPAGVVFHGWARGSHSSVSQILSLLRSYLVYSWIWGLRII
jgi:GT2 family glycosyltransferase